MDWNQLIMVIVTTMAGSTGLNYLLNLRQEKRKAKGLANQEIERGTEISINNANNLIEVYKKAIIDKENYWIEERKLLFDKIDELKSIIGLQAKTISDLEDKICQQAVLMETYFKKEDKLEEDVKDMKEEMSKHHPKVVREK